MNKITSEQIGKVVTSLAKSFDEELFSKSRQDLEEHWHWKWDESLTVLQNTYKFYDLLWLYSSFCRRWEEHHNGHMCVVGRVRDQYLVPKLRLFLHAFRGAIENKATARYQNGESDRDYCALMGEEFDKVTKGFETVQKKGESNE